ncbi:MAG TPA: thiamine phosphate synthase [Paenirhodobacter sp.]
MIGAVYLVTDPLAGLPVIEQARAAALGGAWAVQLRDKTAPDAAFAAQAQALQALLRPLGVRFFVNDRVEIACAIGADGLHIGQGDGDPAQIRARIGAEMILGLSVEDAAQLATIPPGCVDYLGVGPIRATASKADHTAPIGFDGLARICAAAPCPVIAIGGLQTGDMAAVRGSGAVGVAVVSAITRATDPCAATRALLNEWDTQ